MPAQYINFFTVSIQASATLLGLLFVALSVDVALDPKMQVRQFLLCRSAFIALGGILLISFLAISASDVAVTTGGTLLACLGFIDMVFVRRRHAETARDNWFITLTVVVYILLLASSAWIASGDRAAWHGFEAEFIVLYALALLAAWRSLVIAKTF